MVERYITIGEDNTEEIIEKKSRFIANIQPVKNEKEARHFIEEIKKQYWDARHHVFAYRVGIDKCLERCSDDGEPSGTAGMPVLEVVRGNNLKNVAIVVTRYFGGTLLGTGGLVRAYGGSAKACIESAKKIEQILYYLIHVKVDYGLSGKVQYAILQNSHIIYNTDYSDNISYSVLVEYNKINNFQEKIVEVTNNAAVLTKEGLYYGVSLEDKVELGHVII